ncbi:hypothetical protein IL306_002662 [Fusarium sp. DS 682]|nr:hypothetical protein IL306_002662 [Fusarium sp. DS 682]
MDDASLWDYARKSSREVSVISAKLSAKESQVLWQYGRKRHLSKRLGELAGYLLMTYFDSSKRESGIADKPSDKAEMFLEGLERICTAGMKAVGFALEETSAPTATNTEKCQYAGTIKTNAQFCDLVRKRVGPAKLRVKVSGERLLQFRDLEGIDDDIAHEQTITLTDMLSCQPLNSKTRLLIAYTLARSFWQFYNSDWMCAQWSTESVQFFRERKRNDSDTKDGSVLSASPYFAFSFDKNDPVLSTEYLATVCVVHRYPRVLALASLLYEIGRKKRHGTTTRTREEGFGSVEEKINNDFNDIRRGLERDTWTAIRLQPEVQQTYKVIVENCIDPNLFEAAGDSPGGVTIDERRSILHRKVVYPLQTLLQKLNWIDDHGNIRRQEDEDLNITEFAPGTAVSPTQATSLDVSEPLKSRQARLASPSSLTHPSKAFADQ